MTYRDTLYGTWAVPRFIERLMQTREMVRARNINMVVTPNSFMPYGAMPSRFHHGMGVCYLALQVLAHNPHLSGWAAHGALPAAALLHDAGNPPFSHLSEYFLKDATGKNGESFLADMLVGTETEAVLRDIGLTSKEILDLVTGLNQPFAEVLNGSLDIDNLDNIGRFHAAANVDAERYDARAIAHSFRYLDDRWMLHEQCFAECRKWQEARRADYRLVYGEPHLGISVMLYRAVEMAYAEGEIERWFFFLDDQQALAHLAKRCNPRTVCLLDRLTRWQWYDAISVLETITPPQKVVTYARDWVKRAALADTICRVCNLSPEDVCVYIGEGKAERQIRLPFVTENGQPSMCQPPSEPVQQFFRVNVYVPAGKGHVHRKITECVERELF